jgi:hypothetical protein
MIGQVEIVAVEKERVVVVNGAPRAPRLFPPIAKRMRDMVGHFKADTFPKYA